jgi:hypothetical protein
LQETITGFNSNSFQKWHFPMKLMMFLVLGYPANIIGHTDQSIYTLIQNLEVKRHTEVWGMLVYATYVISEYKSVAAQLKRLKKKNQIKNPSKVRK